MRVAIRLLLEQPRLATCLDSPPGFGDLEQPGVELLGELLELLRQRPDINTAGILEHWRGKPEERHLARLATTPLEIPEAGLDPEFRGAIRRLEEQRAAQRMQQLLSRGQALSGPDKDELKQLLASRHPPSGQAR